MRGFGVGLNGKLWRWICIFCVQEALCWMNKSSVFGYSWLMKAPHFLPLFASFYCRIKVGIKVVKIAFWLVKSYDFTSQNMYYELNRMKKSKMSKIEWNRKNRMKLCKITISRPIVRFHQNEGQLSVDWKFFIVVQLSDAVGTFSLPKRGALCPLWCLLPAMGIIQVFFLLFFFLKLSLFT